MNLQNFFVFVGACVIIATAASCSDSGNSTPASSLGSSSGLAGMGGAAGVGGMGMGGQGGAPLQDDVLCSNLMAPVSESIIAVTDAMSAPLLNAPDILYEVTVPSSGGFVAVQTVKMHTTFAVYAQLDESIQLLLEGVPVVENSSDAACNGSIFQRVQHHSHEPTKFTVALPKNLPNKSVVFYHLL